MITTILNKEPRRQLLGLISITIQSTLHSPWSILLTIKESCAVTIKKINKQRPTQTRWKEMYQRRSGWMQDFVRVFYKLGWRLRTKALIRTIIVRRWLTCSIICPTKTIIYRYCMFNEIRDIHCLHDLSNKHHWKK